jgi:hypothetical protein
MAQDILFISCRSDREPGKRITAMTDIDLERDESILSYEISDEALEAAGDNIAAANYTLGACTGLSVCPG